MTDAIAHTALGYFRFKNAFRKPLESDDKPVSYAERVNVSMYSPYVKSGYLKALRFDKKNERPFDKLDKSLSMAQVFKEAVAMYGTKPCLGVRDIIETQEEVQSDGKVFKKVRLSQYNFLTYNNVDAQVDLYGKGLRAIGVKPRENVILFADTRWEWMAMAQALLRQNMPIVTLYSMLSENGIHHGIQETEATVMITSRELLDKFHKSLATLLQLQHIIYMEKEIAPKPTPMKGKTLLSLSELERIAKGAKGEFEEVPPTPDDTAILMYTSGSTGLPKAVILTHRNMLAAARGLCDVFEKLKVKQESDSYIAYLPLAHVFELNCEIIAILYGVRIGYSSPVTLTDSSTGLLAGTKGDCTLLQPTIMACVPLVLDRVKKSILEKAAAKGSTALRVLELAVEDSVRRFKAGQNSTVYDKDVFSEIRSVVGGRIRMIATGSAPLSPETQDFIRAALGCYLIQGYGLTETCAAATCMELNDKSTGSVGAPVNGALVRLEDWTEGKYLVTCNQGEIVVGGEMVAAGYYKNSQLTKECFFEEDGVRWFRTGDIGEVTNLGTFKIIDRKKDLVKLKNGEYIPLGKIETEMKTNHFVEQVCVCADSFQDYIVALVQVNEKNLKALACSVGVDPTKDNKELCKDPAIVQYLLVNFEAQLRRRRFKTVEIPKKLTLCAEEWTPDSGLVTAAFKLRRKQIQEHYQKEIDRMYENSSYSK